MQPEPDLARFRNSNSAVARARFGQNLFWGHRTIHLMKLMGKLWLMVVVKIVWFSVLYLFVCICVGLSVCLYLMMMMNEWTLTARTLVSKTRVT